MYVKMTIDLVSPAEQQQKNVKRHHRKKTIDELSDAITGGKDIGSGYSIYWKKCGNIG